jgi:hypothetical protein
MSENPLYEEAEATEATVKTPKVKTAKSETPLDRLLLVISSKVEIPEVLLEVPSRPGVKLRISPNVSQQHIRAWRKNAGEDSKHGMDSTKFGAYVIGNTTVGIIINDEEVEEDGHAINFASPSILAATDTSRPVPDAVRAFFGVDAHVESAALAILDAAGYGDTVEVEDPMKESSTN